MALADEFYYPKLNLSPYILVPFPMAKILNIRLETTVDGNYKDVMARFDKSLFEALKPKYGKMEVLEFTGSETGDIVRLKFHTPMKADWVSHIVDHGTDKNQAYFIDEGTILPFPLTYWRHKHIVEKIDNNRSIIIDDMTFSAGNIFFTLLMYPALYLAFYPRKKIYKRYFRQ